MNSLILCNTDGNEPPTFTMKTCLQDLPTELLIKIFEYCDLQELFELKQTCSRFHEIIKKATSLGNSNPLIVTNQLRSQIRNRCVVLLTLEEKCRIANNWKNGIYKENYMFKEKRRYIPCLILTKEQLWLSKGNSIRAYKRNKYKIEEHPCCSMVMPNVTDVCKFVFKQNYLMSGQQDGSILFWKSEDDAIHLQNCHRSDVNSVDLVDDIWVSGSKDNYIKIWTSTTGHQKKYKPSFTYNMKDRVWSTAFSNGGQYLAVGTAGYESVPPLHLFDVNRSTIVQKLGQDFWQGSGILQIKWENPSMLLTCGYDKNIRKWDTRTGTCEQSWEDPYYTTVYCFDTDNYCSIVSGTQNHGRVVLWDTRSKQSVQVYFVHTSKRRFFNSPVYSLSFDVCQLFAATDRYLNILDFSIKKGLIRNYNIFNTENM